MGTEFAEHVRDPIVESADEHVPVEEPPLRDLPSAPAVSLSARATLARSASRPGARGSRRTVAVPPPESDGVGSGRIQRAATPGVAEVGHDGGSVSDDVDRAIRSSTGQPLESGVRGQMESAFGADFGSVRIHTDSDVAPRISASAFTLGADVHFARGAFDPTSRGGLHTLAHELTHVVQQGGAGPVRRSFRVSAEDSTGVIRRSAEDGQPDPLPDELTVAAFQRATSVRGSKRGESLRTIDKWLVQAARPSPPSTYGLQQYAIRQVIEAADHWLRAKHPEGTPKEKSSVRKRRAAIQAVRARANVFYSGMTPIAAPGASTGVTAHDDDSGLKSDVASGAIDTIASGAGSTGDFADINLVEGNAWAEANPNATAPSDVMSQEGGAKLNQPAFDILEGANVPLAILSGRSAFKDLEEAEDNWERAEAGGKVMAATGQGIHGAYKLSKGIAIESGKDATEMTQLGDIGAAYGDGLAAIAEFISFGKGIRDARKKSAEEGGLTGKEKVNVGLESTQSFLSGSQAAVKTGLDITKAATEVGATGAIVGLSTAAGAIGIVVSTIEMIRGGVQIYQANASKNRIKEAIAAQNQLLADTKTAIARVNEEFEIVAWTTLDFDELDELLDQLEVLEDTYGQMVAVQEQYAPAMEGMRKLQTREMEAGGFKIAKGTAGVVGGALLLSGVGAPIGIAIAAIGAILALSEAGLKLARNSSASQLTLIARRLTPDGVAKGKPDDAPEYREMERRIYAAYYRNLADVVAGSLPFGFTDGEFTAIKQFAWEDKKSRIAGTDKLEAPLTSLAAVRTLSDDDARSKWIEVQEGDTLRKEKPKNFDKAGLALKPSAHKSSAAMDASRSDVVDALYALGHGSFALGPPPSFANSPVVPQGAADPEQLAQMGKVTVDGLMAAADITPDRWAAWLLLADNDETEMRKLILKQLP